MSSEALAVVRAAVAAAEPGTVDEAARMLTHAAHHMGRAERRGEPLALAAVFGPASVQASIDEARAETTRSVSPFETNLRRVALRAAPRSGHAPRLSVAQPPPKPAYDPAEISSLHAAAIGMVSGERVSFLGALALGVGAGLIGPRATSLRVEDLVVDADAVWVPAAWTPAGWLPVTGRWADVLRSIVQLDPAGPVTEAYTTAGAQRLRRCLSRAVGVPPFDADRLRATRIANLLAGDVPIDAIATAADIRPWSLVKYTSEDPTPSQREVVSWLTTSGSARPMRALPAPPQPKAAVASGGGESSIADVVDTFVPADDAVAALWTAALGKDLRDLIVGSADTAGRALNLTKAVSALLTWSVHQSGIPLHVDALLKPSTLDRFMAVVAKTNAASAASYGPLLRAMAVGATTMPPKPVAAARRQVSPLAEAEVEQLKEVRASLTPAERRVLDAYRALGLGAGLREEIPAVRSNDVIADGDVHLVQLSDRIVPVNPDWARFSMTWFGARRPANHSPASAPAAPRANAPASARSSTST